MEKLKKISKEQWIGIGIFFSFLFAIFLFLAYPRFCVKEFQSKLEVPWNEEYFFHPGRVCYGSFFSCHEVQVEEQSNVDTSKIGEYTVTYIYSYHGKQFSKKQNVSVVDQKAPSLEVFGDHFSYCPNGVVPNYEVKAMDDYDGDLSKDVVISIGKDGLVFSVQDHFGNKTTVVKEAAEKDEEAPNLKLKGNEVVYLLKDSVYEEEGAEAYDNCDGDLTSKIEIQGQVDSSKVGEYRVVYSVKDSSGLTSEVERIVHVYQKDSHYIAGKTIYLTFDDGPSSYTEKLLDILKKYQVKATFFVTNQRTSYGYEDFIRRAYQEGHSIGLHTFSHVYSQVYSNVDNYFADLEAIQRKVERLTGYKSMLVRFPGGSSNTISKNYDGGKHIMSQLSKELEKRGYRYFDWNVLSGDAGETTSTSVVVKNVTSSLHGKDSYVVLQHDTKGFSVDAVEEIIQYGIGHGYVFLPITMDTLPVHHGINN